jgi:hypothetical protein
MIRGVKFQSATFENGSAFNILKALAGVIKKSKSTNAYQSKVGRAAISTRWAMLPRYFKNYR